MGSHTADPESFQKKETSALVLNLVMGAPLKISVA